MATSVIAAVIERFNTLAWGSPAPKLWFDEAPIRDGAGAAIAPPYVVLKDDGTAPEYDYELNVLETTTFRFEVYAPTLAEADSIANTLKYNSQSIAGGAGFDFAAALSVTSYTLKSCVRDMEQRFQEGDRGADAKPVFRVRMRYKVEMLRS